MSSNTDGGCFSAVTGTTEGAGQSSTEGGEGKIGSGRGGSTMGGEDSSKGRLAGVGGARIGQLRASVTWFVAPGVYRLSLENSEM
jgi:hypothetical protein